VAGHTAPVHRATLNCVVPKKLGLFSYEQAYQPLRIGSFQREVQLWDVAPPSDENRSRGDGLDKSQLASGCSIKKKETRILPNSTPWPKPSSHSDPHISDPRCHPTMMGLSRREFSFDKYSPSCSESPLLPKEGACRSIFGLRGGMDGRALLLVGSRWPRNYSI
jgi:hypothetical protein